MATLLCIADDQSIPEIRKVFLENRHRVLIFQKRFASPCRKLVFKKLIEVLIPRETIELFVMRLAPQGRAS
jgi:hypothetical protein